MPLWFPITLYEVEISLQDSLSEILQLKILEVGMNTGLPDAKVMARKILSKREYGMPENLMCGSIRLLTSKPITVNQAWSKVPWGLTLTKGMQWCSTADWNARTASTLLWHRFGMVPVSMYLHCVFVNRYHSFPSASVCYIQIVSLELTSPAQHPRHICSLFVFACLFVC